MLVSQKSWHTATTLSTEHSQFIFSSCVYQPLFSRQFGIKTVKFMASQQVVSRFCDIWRWRLQSQLFLHILSPGCLPGEVQLSDSDNSSFFVEFAESQSSCKSFTSIQKAQAQQKLNVSQLFLLYRESKNLLHPGDVGILVCLEARKHLKWG